MRRLAALVLACLPASHAVAQTCQEAEARDAAQRYDTLLRMQTNCLADIERDRDPLVAAFDAATPSDARDALVRFDNVDKALGLMLEELGRIGALAQTVVSDSQRLAARLSYERDRLRSIGPTATQAEIDAVLPELLSSRGYWAFNGGRLAADGAAIDLWRHTCNSPATACPEYEAQKRLIRVVKLVDALGKYADAPNLLSHYQDAKLEDARWKAYFNDAMPQYWWEVAVNGWRMGEELCPHASDSGIQRGFCKVPHDQWIVLHPEAGLEWRDEAGDSDEFEPAFVVQVFGRHWWTWDGAHLRNRFGASLVAAYTNRHGVSDFSYGVMLQAGDGFNLAVTTTEDGDVGVLINLNLAKRYFGRKQEYVDYLRALRKPGITDVVLGDWP